MDRWFLNCNIRLLIIIINSSYVVLITACVYSIHRILSFTGINYDVLWWLTFFTVTREPINPYMLIIFWSFLLSLTRSSHCEYMEEFPIQALPQFSSLSGHEISSHGLMVLVMQYGKKKIDYLGRGRAQTDWTKAWKSNFLHPVLYYYDKLPTGE